MTDVRWRKGAVETVRWTWDAETTVSDPTSHTSNRADSIDQKHVIAAWKTLIAASTETSRTVNMTGTA